MKRTAATRIGILTTALALLFTLVAIAPVEAKQITLKSQLRTAGISMKIVRLDRTDGFVFGLSFTGPNSSFVLAPGLNRMWLAQMNGDEIIMQRDAAGKMQIIQSTTDISYALCIVQSIVTFLSDLTLCQAPDATCLFTSIIALVTNIVSCNSVVTPTT